MSDEHETIERDFSAADLKAKTVWRIIAIALALIALAWFSVGHA